MTFPDNGSVMDCQDKQSQLILLLDIKTRARAPEKLLTLLRTAAWAALVVGMGAMVKSDCGCREIMRRKLICD